jgi:hypothetical protein
MKSLKGRTASIVISIAFLATLALLGWAFDIPLFLKIRSLSSTTFEADARHSELRVADLEELNAYPPRRLARFLSYPSAKSRALVCFALAHRHNPGDAESWTGVLPALLHAYRRTEKHERDAVSEALTRLPWVRPSEAEHVFTFVDEQLGAAEWHWSLCAQLLETTARTCPEQRDRAIATFGRALDIGARIELEETLLRLANIAPTSDVAAKAVRTVAALPPIEPASFPTILRLKWPANLPPSLFAVLQQQPSLIDEFLNGSPREQLVALAAANRVLGGFSLSGDQPPTMACLPAERLERMKKVAVAMLDMAPADDPNGDDAVGVQFLGYTPGNEDLLFDAARKVKGPRRVELLGWAFFGANKQGRAHAECWVQNRLPELLTWLDSGDEEIQRRVLGIIFPYQREPDWLKRLHTSPNAQILEACRRLFDKQPGRHDYYFLQAVSGASTEIDPRDVDRVVACFDHTFSKALKDAQPGQKPWVALTSAERRVLQALEKHAERPSVRRILDARRRLAWDGALRNAAFE